MTDQQHSPFNEGPTATRSISLNLQLSVLLVLLALLTFVSSVLVSTSNMRDYLDTQLSQSAKDTANSLGLSISPYVGGADITVAETMVSAIFDSGAYLKMKYTDNQQQVVFDRTTQLELDEVPAWFIQWFHLAPPVMTSEVNDGWRIAGTLMVQAHPGYAYISLWRHTKAVFWNSLLICLLALVAVHILLIAVLKPLKDIEKQAQNLAEKRFELLDYMPMTTELQAVVRALNRMVAHVRRNFNEMTDRAEQLNQQVYLDALTTLPNRRALMQSFTALNQLSGNEDDQHYIMLVALCSLKHVNDSQGYAAGDLYVQKAADLLLHHVRGQESAQLFRISGSEFAVLTRAGQSSADEFRRGLMQTFEIARTDQYPAGFAAVVMRRLNAGEDLSTTLSRLDSEQARQDMHPTEQNQGVSAELPLSRSNWQDILHQFTRSVVSDTSAGFSDTSLQISNEMAQMFSLEVQPVYQQQEVVYIETFVRFTSHNQQLASADVFAMAERLGVSLLLDKALVTYILNQLRGLTGQRFAINLSKSALHDEQFTLWLANTISSNQAQLPQLVFEVNEQATLGAIGSAKRFFDLVKFAGAAVTIERFGASFSSFRYLQGLNVDFIKIDGSFIRALDEADTRFFVETMTHICHGIGIRVIAAQVETKAQVEHCQQLHVDALQGRALHHPISFQQFRENNGCNFDNSRL
jgi:diguanylate cyclase (GGDEF)-like protein